MADENSDHSPIFRIETLAFMILWQAIADGMYPICSQKSMPSWYDCLKESGTGAKWIPAFLCQTLSASASRTGN